MASSQQPAASSHVLTYLAADGITRTRCRQHVPQAGPRRATGTPREEERVTYCVECNPWILGQGDFPNEPTETADT